MKIEERYERTLTKNEFVLTVDEYGMNSSYQERMILENEIPGILPLKIEYKNERKEYRYEISNQINLEEWGKMEKISYEFLKSFLLQIAACFDVLDRYMLEEEKLMFHPTHIFFDKDTKKLHMLFFPEKKDEKDDFVKLTEYLITIIKQEEALVVWTAYVLEKDAKMENFSLIAFLASMRTHEQESIQDEKVKEEQECRQIEPVEIDAKKEKEKVNDYIPIYSYIRLGVAFGLAAIYFVAGNLITGRYAFEYEKSMLLLGILVAITVGVILFTIFNMIKEKNEDGWEDQLGDE